MAEWTGLEPATSGVTGQHSNQLNYHSAKPAIIPGHDDDRKQVTRWPWPHTNLVGAEGIEPPTLSV